MESTSDRASHPMSPSSPFKPPLALSPTSSVATVTIPFNFTHFRQFIGPAILISIAYIDPGSLSGDLEAGTSGHYQLLWVLLCSSCYGLLFQIVSSRVGTVTGCDLSTLCSKSFRKWISVFLWISCEVGIMGSDIQQVIGSAVAMNILFGIPLWVGALITIFDALIILFASSYGMKALEYMLAVAVLCICGCFMANLIMTNPDVPELLLSCVYPRIPPNTVIKAVALVGSNLTPHNIYLHSSLVQTREIDHRNKYAVKEALMYFYTEASLMMAVAFIINLTVLGTFAVFPGKTLGLMTAGDALEGSFGLAGKYIWAVGLICSGQSATLTGTLAGQYVMQGFVHIRVSKFMRSLITRSLAIIPSILVVMFVTDLTSFTEYINVSQVFILPLVVVPLLKVAVNKRIMREYAMGWAFFTFLGMVCLLLTSANIYFNTPDPDETWNQFLCYVSFLPFYVAFIVFLILQELKTDFDIDELRRDFDVVFGPFKMEEPATEIIYEEDESFKNDEEKVSFTFAKNTEIPDKNSQDLNEIKEKNN